MIRKKIIKIASVWGVILISGCLEPRVSLSLNTQESNPIKTELKNKLSSYEYQIQNATSGKVTHQRFSQIGDSMDSETQWFEFSDSAGRWNYGGINEKTYFWTMVERYDDFTMVQHDFHYFGPFHDKYPIELVPTSIFFTEDVILNDVDDYPSKTDYVQINQSTYQAVMHLRDLNEALLNEVFYDPQLWVFAGSEIESYILTITYEFDDSNFSLKSTLDLHNSGYLISHNEIAYEGINSYNPMAIESFIDDQAKSEMIQINDLIIGQSQQIDNHVKGQFFRVDLVHGKEYHFDVSVEFESMELYNSSYELTTFESILIDSLVEGRFMIKETGTYYLFIYVSHISYYIQLFLPIV